MPLDDIITKLQSVDPATSQEKSLLRGHKFHCVGTLCPIYFEVRSDLKIGN